MAKFERYYKGKLWELKFDKSTKSFYTMYPTESPKNGKRKTKRKWLGSVETQATINFKLFWDTLEGSETTHIPTDTEIYSSGSIGFFDMAEMEYKPAKIKVNIPEDYYYNWLRSKILNEQYQDLATGTGFQNLVRLPEILNHNKNILLSDLYENYQNSKQYRNITDKDEKNKIKSAWKLFLSIIQKEGLEQITFKDTKKYEKYLHKQNYTDKTTNHYKNRVSKIFRYNLKEFIDTTKLQQVLEYFKKWEKLEINTVDSINAEIISLDDFNILYEEASLELKAVIMFCLNTGTYIREVARIKKSDINFDTKTLATQRSKTGKCRKFAYLWDRTIEALNDYLEQRKDNTDILFIAKHGGHYKNGEGLRTKFWELRKNVKKTHIEFQYLRDTFETIGNESGISQYHIDMVMGHSSGKTSERYSHRRIHNELKDSCLQVEQAYFEKAITP